ncbi:hypothetical protein G9A89_004317 [Geosiphon pyriformis]|nr:hypothetical protein G9A89_004317 [Geosiphon pyriformis]
MEPNQKQPLINNIPPATVTNDKFLAYQALIGNNRLVKTNAVLDWTTQELQLSQNSQHMQLPATCGHFKPTTMPAPLIEFEEKKEKPIWKAFQVLWANKNHNKLLSIFL